MAASCHEWEPDVVSWHSDFCPLPPFLSSLMLIPGRAAGLPRFPLSLSWQLEVEFPDLLGVLGERVHGSQVLGEPETKRPGPGYPALPTSTSAAPRFPAPCLPSCLLLAALLMTLFFTPGQCPGAVSLQRRGSCSDYHQRLTGDGPLLSLGHISSCLVSGPSSPTSALSQPSSSPLPPQDKL